MTEFTFIHASDLHLGRRFTTIPQATDWDVRGRLIEARFEKLAALAQAARQTGASDILLAGDTFDSATPSDQVVVQALRAIADHADLTWWLLPGNHDNLRDAEPLWDRIAGDGPPNLRPLHAAAPVTIAPDVALLPAPVTFRATGRDLTHDLVAMTTPPGTVRLGLAHGGVVDFSDSGAHIPPDRDRSAGLDYLALGDWHGRKAISARVHYCGTPEQDRFRHSRRGVCLSVHLRAGTAPVVTEVETGSFLWREVDLPLLSGQDAAAALAAVLPATGRRDQLLRIVAAGRTGLAARAALLDAATAVAPEFALFELRDDGLQTDVAAADLDAIDRAGALRTAAETLRAEAENQDLNAQDRAVASAALDRLYSLVTGGAA